MNPHAFLNQLHAREIENAIAEAERRTSGEIRVFISHQPAPEPMAAARAHFRELGMHRARHRNAVLIFIAPVSQTFAIIGGDAIHERRGPEFWQAVRDEMATRLKNRDYLDALLHAIRRTGEALAQHFPPDRENPDELSNRLVQK